MLLVMVWVVRYLLTRWLVLKRRFIAIFVVALVFALWIGIEAFRSPQPVRGATMWVMTCRNLAILWIAGTLLAELHDLRLLNRFVFLLGVGMALGSMVFYAGSLREHSSILLDPELSIEFFEAGVLRLEGFVADPNFFGLFLSFSFLCGLAADGLRPAALRWAGLVVLGAALLLTFSRGVLLSLILSAILLGVAGVLRRRSLWLRYAARVLVLLAVVGGVALLVPVPSIGVSPLKWLVARFAVIGTRPSWPAWVELLPMTLDHPLLGHGLRMVEVVLRGAYSHNSYLDLLLETGAIGLCIFALFGVLVIREGVRASAESADVLPWLHACVLTLLMFFFFSILYNPPFWIVAGVILARASPQNSHRMLPA
jgi:O-antigen ligase